MAKQLFTNNATCYLAVALGGLITDTTMYLEAGKGALFPNPTGGDWFLTTLVDAAGNWEIVKVTARATDTCTIVRGQEGSTIRAFDTPGTTKVGLRPTKGTLENLAQKPEIGMDTLAIATIAGNTAAAATDFKPLSQLSRITATATVTLPAASTVTSGYSRVYKSLTTGDVQFAPNGTDTIDGVNANFRLPSYCEIEFVSDGVSAWVLMRRPNVWVGKMETHGAAAAPSGYLACDGASYLRTDYAGLFAAIGTTFGSVDGTHFSVPDMRDRVPVGAGTASAVFESPSNITVAANAVPLASNDKKWITGMPVAVSNSTITGLANGNYWIIRVDATHVSFASSLANAQNGNVLAISGAAVGCAITHALTARTLGEIGGEEAHAMSSTELLEHAHKQRTLTDSGGGAYTLSAPVAGNNVQNSSFTVSTGSNAAMNIMQPFLACNYAIKT